MDRTTLAITAAAFLTGFVLGAAAGRTVAGRFEAADEPDDAELVEIEV